MSEQDNTTSVETTSTENTTSNTSTNTLETRVQELETKLNGLLTILKSCYVNTTDIDDNNVTVWQGMYSKKSDMDAL